VRVDRPCAGPWQDVDVRDRAGCSDRGLWGRWRWQLRARHQRQQQDGETENKGASLLAIIEVGLEACGDGWIHAKRRRAFLEGGHRVADTVSARGRTHATPGCPAGPPPET